MGTAVVIELTKEQEEYLKRDSSQMVIFHEGKERSFYYLPFWYEDRGNGTYYAWMLGQLPEELMDAIMERRRLFPIDGERADGTDQDSM